MHTIRFPLWMFEEKVLRRVDRNDYYFVFYLLCFVLLVQKVKADSKQTNKQRKWRGAYRANKPLSDKRETRDWLILTDTINLEKYTTSEKSSSTHSHQTE